MRWGGWKNEVGGVGMEKGWKNEVGGGNGERVEE